MHHMGRVVRGKLGESHGFESQEHLACTATSVSGLPSVLHRFFGLAWLRSAQRLQRAGLGEGRDMRAGTCT